MTSNVSTAKNKHEWSGYDCGLISNIERGWAVKRWDENLNYANVNPKMLKCTQNNVAFTSSKTRFQIALPH